MTKKEQIIYTALDLFAKHGYTETSIDKIAKTAGVSKGLTYNHFKNKEDLLCAVILETMGEMTEMLTSVDEDVNIGGLIKIYFELLRQQQATIRLCVLLIVHPETPIIVRNMLAQQQVELLALLTHLLTPLYSKNSHLEARILLATIDGITLDYITNSEEKTLVEMEVYLLQKYSQN